MAKKKHDPPNVGAVFRHRYKGKEYHLTVVKAEEGIEYELLGRSYKSPTAAARALVKEDYRINGRSFWHMND